MQPFNNKSSFDPGRFRYKLTFLQEVATDSGYGDTDSVVLTEILTVRAVQLQMTSRLSISQNTGAGTGQTIAGVTLLSDDKFFIIRKRSDFYPDKTMQVVYAGSQYEIREIVEVDQPQHYVRVLLTNKKDFNSDSVVTYGFPYTIPVDLEVI